MSTQYFVPGMGTYTDLQNTLARGWNTWNTRNVLCWVHLPEAFALNLGVKDYTCGTHLREVFAEKHDVRLGAHAGDGSYSRLELRFGKTHLILETATDDGDLVVLAKPVCEALRTSLLVVEAGFLWNRPGKVWRDSEGLAGEAGQTGFRLYVTTGSAEDPNIVAMTPYLGLPLDGALGLATGRRRTLAEIAETVERRKAVHEARRKPYADHAGVYDAIQTCTAWDTIYEPIESRVITTVSRNWNAGSRGGHVLFCWDTFFSAMLASVDNKELAYANVIEILREKAPRGFVPNNSQATGRKALDRSQPPVGAITTEALYGKFGDRWLLQETFGDLLVWNRWWAQNRFIDGYMCWGSNPFDPVVGDPREYNQPNTVRGAVLESGLDNSPMYDGVAFDPRGHLLLMADAGLMGLYAADCFALARMATVLDKPAEAGELMKRGRTVVSSLQGLWDETRGIYLNRRLDTNEPSPRLSPTNFYPLLARAASDAQADRMIEEHFYNSGEFWGEWIMPSIARSDPAFADQDYWRGRIWPPMNWLVYLGLCNYTTPTAARARKDLAEKSSALLMKEWNERRHIHENYCPDTGEGCNSVHSEAFYHWGGLLGLIALTERERS